MQADPVVTSELDRSRFWRSLGATAAETEELLAYALGSFDHCHLPTSYPLPDEPFVEAWRSYVERAREEGVLQCLREQLIELRIPVQQGISETTAYRTATRRGEWMPETGSWRAPDFLEPDAMQIFVYQTPAGHIPVLVATAREDFHLLVQLLTRHNEPWPVPASMGACIVTGYNNWGRIMELRRQWEAMPARQRSPADWKSRFRQIAAQPELYRDRFILLSSGPYSAVSAGELGLADREWNRRSLIIRLEHECTHYFTSQVLGSMNNALTDELIADYMGIVASEGRYRADWFLRFVGLEDFPRYRPGARMDIYRGDPPLSDGAFAILHKAVRCAAENLQRIDSLRLRHGLGLGTAGKARVIIALARLGLEGMADSAAVPAFERALVPSPGEAPTSPLNAPASA